MLFFKHLYLICRLFYNTLSYGYVIHSTSFHTSGSANPLIISYTYTCPPKNCFKAGYRKIGIKCYSKSG